MKSNISKKQKVEFICPCGSGQSCIVVRRKNNDWVTKMMCC